MKSAYAAGSTLLAVHDLRVRFFARGTHSDAVRGVNFSLNRGDTLAILGESGSGKSVTLRALMNLLSASQAKVSGQVVLNGNDLLQLPQRALAEIRGRDIAMAFQEPALAFDPVFPIGQQIAEIIRQHTGVGRATARGQVVELLDRVQIPAAAKRFNSYPHEMSGGMLQRAMIAAAVCCRPKVLLADEPTTSLDTTVQTQILLLLRSLQQECDMAVIFVTHDVGVAVEMADTIAVMYAGRFVERAPVREVLLHAQHPYTQALLASSVRDKNREGGLAPISGAPPDPSALLPGCQFAPRCGRRLSHCDRIEPCATEISQDHRVSCHLYTENAL